jgi:hypothetical protein
MSEGKLQRNSSGKFQRNSDGKIVRNSATSTTCCCDATYYRVRRCCDDTYVNFAMSSEEIPQLPFTFVYNETGGGECWYITSTNTTTDAVTYPLILESETTEYTDCDDCRGTCNSCASGTACAGCASCDSTTPTQFTVTLSGITLHTACSTENVACDDGTFTFKVSSGTYTGGTYTIDNRIAACEWESDSFTGPTVSRYTGGACSVLDATITDTFSVTILRTGGGLWILQVVATSGGPEDCGIAQIFVSEAIADADFDCCGQNTFVNRLTDPGTVDDNGDMIIGTGGTAVVTPC